MGIWVVFYSFWEVAILNDVAMNNSFLCGSMFLNVSGVYLEVEFLGGIVRTC